MTKKFFSGIVAASAILFTSCLNDSEHLGQIVGYFTLNNSLNETNLYMDGGGVITLSQNSVSTYKEFLSKSKRFNLMLTYPEDAVIKEGDVVTKITNADIVDGQYLPVSRPMTISEADNRKVTVADSINDVLDYEFWVAGGYANIVTRSLWIQSGNKNIAPSVSMVFEEIEGKANEFNVTFYNNWHSTDPSKDSKPGQTDFPYTFELTNLRYSVHSTDDITLHLKVMKCQESSKAEKTVKVKYKDLCYPF